MAPVHLLIGVVLAGNVDPTEKVLRDMQRIDQVVIKAASLAQRRAGRDDVRTFAQRLEMDHRFAHHQGLSLARELELQLPAPDPGSEEAKRLEELSERVSELEALRGPEFDLAFLRLMRVANMHAIDTLTSAERHVSPALVRAFDRLIPIFEQHVELAVRLTGSTEARAEAEGE
jgi:predicted outer membrane protein